MCVLSWAPCPSRPTCIWGCSSCVASSCLTLSSSSKKPRTGTKTMCGEFGLVNPRLQPSSKHHLFEDVDVVQIIRSAVPEMSPQDRATIKKTVVILVCADLAEVWGGAAMWTLAEEDEWGTEDQIKVQTRQVAAAVVCWRWSSLSPWWCGAEAC